ncbi:MAG TPA: hypothetical protein VFD58_04360 [Blastocatellia bacterium]|nr:hypothetical protein [Blastocatellia bacterium]
MHSSPPRRTLVCLLLCTLAALLFASCSNTGNTAKIENKIDTKIKIAGVEITSSDAEARAEALRKKEAELHQRELEVESKKRELLEKENTQLQEENERLKQPQSARPERKTTPAQPRSRCQMPCVQGSYTSSAGAAYYPAVYNTDDDGQNPKSRSSGTPQNPVYGQIADIQQTVHQMNGRMQNIEYGVRDLRNTVSEVQGGVAELRNRTQELGRDVMQLNQKTGVHKRVPSERPDRAWCITHQKLEKW